MNVALFLAYVSIWILSIILAEMAKRTLYDICQKYNHASTTDKKFDDYVQLTMGAIYFPLIGLTFLSLMMYLAMALK